MISQLYRSDVALYYLAVFIGFIGISMMIIFVPFKSVATLMMMLSGFALLSLAVFLLFVSIAIDLKKKYLDKPYNYPHSED